MFAFLGKDVILNLEAYKTFNEENLRTSNVYLCRGYSSQLKKSMPYRKMKKFIQINLVDHVKRGILQDKLVQRYFLEEQGYPLTDDIQIYYIRLDLLDKLNYNVGISDEEFLDILRYFKSKGEDERQKLKEKWRTIMTMDEYMNALLSDEVMNEERSMFKKARDYGLEEGINIGKTEGMNAEKRSVAQRLLKTTDDLDYIAMISELSKDEIRKLQNN